MRKQISVLLAITLAITSFSGCMGNKPENIVDKFCASMIAFDEEAASQYTIDGKIDVNISYLESTTDDGINIEPITNYIKENASKITYEIGEVTTESDSAVVPVQFTFVDASPIMIATVGDYISQALLLTLSGADEATIEALIVTIFDEKVDTVDTTETTANINFECEKVDGDWKIAPLSDEDQETLTAVLTCNITNAAESVF